MSEALSGKREIGFTLVEVMVALAVTTALVSILMGSLFHIFRVQESLRAEVQDRELRLRAHAWFRMFFAGCVPFASGEEGGFVGQDRRALCETTNRIVPRRMPVPGVASLALEESENAVSLIYQGRASESDKKMVLMRWPASGAKFVYLDAQGQEREGWPSPETPEQLLPTAVKMIVHSPPPAADIVWFAPFQADPWRDETPKLPPGLNMDMFR